MRNTTRDANHTKITQHQCVREKRSTTNNQLDIHGKHHRNAAENPTIKPTSRSTHNANVCHNGPARAGSIAAKHTTACLNDTNNLLTHTRPHQTIGNRRAPYKRHTQVASHINPKYQHGWNQHGPNTHGAHAKQRVKNNANTNI